MRELTPNQMPLLPRTHRPLRLTKLQETCGRLTDLAHQLGPDAKLPTVLQLRDTLGVSVATLNAALSELESQRIIRRKHGVGIYVSPRIRQRKVALICDPSFFQTPGASPFWSLLAEQVRERAAQGREVISMHFAIDSLDRQHPAIGADLLNQGLADDIAAGRLDGVLGVGLPEELALWIERHHVPMVAFAGPAACMVGLDSSSLIRLGVGALARQGCKRIALWAPVAPYRIFRENEVTGRADLPRLHLFQETLQAHGLPFDPALVRENSHLILPGSYHTESHQAQGFRTAQEVFGPNVDPNILPPDGIFSIDDMLTVGALTALGKLGIQVGKDVKIATHANVGSPALLGWEEELTRVEVDPAEIVSLMFELLETCMEGETPTQPIALAQGHLQS